MSDIFLRPAKITDAADLAILEDIAGHGISLWFWMQEIKSGFEADAMALGKQRMASDDLICGWKNSVVAVNASDQVIGNIASYLMPTQEESLDEAKTNTPVFVPVYELFAKTTGSWLVDSLGVYPEFRGQGAGRILLKDSLERAQNSGVSKASLVVENSNKPALNLYAEFGFETTDSRPFIEFNGPSATTEWLLMQKIL
ncbi:MAG: GNAT family N-acetyltransferase [Pseudomonadota bacterium]